METEKATTMNESSRRERMTLEEITTVPSKKSMSQKGNERNLEITEAATTSSSTRNEKPHPVK